MWLLALVLGAEILSLALLLEGRARSKRLALALALLALPLPWLVPGEWPRLRALTALAVTLLLANTIDFTRRPESMSLSRRIWCLTSVFDARSSRRVTPEISLAKALSVIPFAGVALLGWYLFAWEAHLPMRWAGGLLGFYGCVEVLTRCMEISYRSLGVAIPQTQDHPILATSIGEFWGRRWNRPVSRWLRLHCFLPRAKRGHPYQGIAAAFLASTFLHFYFVWTALGLDMGLLMASFFVAQAPLLLAERYLGVRRWSRALAHAWTILVLALASPLFMEPMLRLIAP
jgi:hypothetical protein